MPSKATTDCNEILEWAKRHALLPVEVLPSRIDSEPSTLAFAAANEIRGELRGISWEHFFSLFAVQDLALVYDAGEDDHPGTSLYEIVHNRPKSTSGQPLAQA